MKLFLIFGLLLSSASFADSYDYTKKFGIGGSYGYNTPIFNHYFNKEANEGETYSVHGRYHFTKHYGLEAAFTKHEFKKTTKALNVYDVVIFRRLMPLSRFTPVLGLGAGVIDFLNYDEDNMKLGLKARAGVEYAINQSFSLGAFVDYQHVNKMFFQKNLDQHNVHVLAARVGLTWYFGQCQKSTAAKEVVKTASPSNKDTDGDGVLNSEDKCPNTEPGQTVNAYGCVEDEKATVKLNVQFDSGSSKVSNKYHQNLKEVADFMKKHSNTEVEIQGHTDNSGNKELNKKLSQLRADAVKDYLVQKLGIDSNRLNAVGYGDEQPVASNNTPSGKSANRRVMAVIEE